MGAEEKAKQTRYGFFWKYIPRYALPFIIALFFLAIESACDLFQPTVMARVIDEGIAARDVSVVMRLGGFMLLVTAFGACAAASRNSISSRVSQGFGASLREDLYAKILSLRAAEINRFETSSLVNRLTNDATQVQNFVNGLMRIFVKAPLLAIGGIAMAVRLDARMALPLVISLPIAVAVVAFGLRSTFPVYRRIQASLDGINASMREYLSGVRVVKAFGGHDREAARFSAKNEGLTGLTLKAMRTLAVFTPCATLALNAGIAAVLWFGGAGVIAGRTGAGKAVAIVNYMTQILHALTMLTFIFNILVRARASSERIAEVFAADNGVPEAAAAAPPAGSSRVPGRSAGLSIEFDDVWLWYDGEEERAALRGLSFSCGAGKTLGVIGSTGSGKTSLARLLCRLYAPKRGRVLLGGREIDSVDSGDSRETIAFVPQRTILFTGSVADNIRWGREDASDEDVARAAKAACADEFVSAMREGYGTMIGRGGLDLSGGQRQRLAIARALARRPALLVLDDCTSSVDSLTEARIRASLRHEAGGATLVVITQRVSSIRGADAILVLDEGQKAGFGTHDELLRSCETYRDICRSQDVPIEAARG
jgi:ATP-binding cassette, subfamily B, multidrug efflux pump